MRLVVFLLWLLYFLQGVPYGFQTKFLPVLLRNYSVSLTLISFTRLLSLPWLLKPLWAPLVDRFGTKIVWIKYNLLGMGLCYLMASFISLSNVIWTVIIVGCLNIMAATQDIAVDSLFVDQLTSEEIGPGNIAQVVGYKAGSLFGGGFLGWLSSSYPWQQLFFFLFTMYMISCSPFFINLKLPPQVIQSKVIGKTPNDNEQSSEHVQRKLNCINLQKECKSIEQNDTKFEKQLKGREAASDLSATSRKRVTPQSIMQNEGIQHFNTKNSEFSATQIMPNSRAVDKANIGFLETYLNIYQNVLESEDTKWTIVYVLIYKLGEQGIIAMFPMFLLDQGMSSSETAMLTGVLCQFCSIFGSLIGGILVSIYYWRGFQGKLVILSTIRLVVTCALTWLASLNAVKTTWIGFVIFDCLLHLMSGMITTVTFTLMMTCSQKCLGNLSATHYSTLATFEVLGKLCMVSVSGTIVEIIGYINFFTICTFLTLLPIILLRFAITFQDGKVVVNAD